MDKVFLWSVKTIETKYGKMYSLGFTDKDIEIIKKHQNDKGRTNFTLKTSKEGKPYIELYVPQTQEPEQTIDDFPF